MPLWMLTKQPSFAGPTDFRNMATHTSNPSTAVAAPSLRYAHNYSTTHPPVSSYIEPPASAPLVGSSAVLERFALAHDVQLGSVHDASLLKRPTSSGNEPLAHDPSKRACIRSTATAVGSMDAPPDRVNLNSAAAPIHSDMSLSDLASGRGSASMLSTVDLDTNVAGSIATEAVGATTVTRDSLTVGMASALLQPDGKVRATKPRMSSRLSVLVDALASGGHATQVMQSQVLNLPPTKIGRPPKGPVASNSRPVAPSARSRRQARLREQVRLIRCCFH